MMRPWAAATLIAGRSCWSRSAPIAPIRRGRPVERSSFGRVLTSKVAAGRSGATPVAAGPRLRLATPKLRYTSESNALSTDCMSVETATGSLKSPGAAASLHAVTTKPSRSPARRSDRIVTSRREASGDETTAEEPIVRIIQDARLSRCDGPHRLREAEREAALCECNHRAGHRARAVAALHPHRVTGAEGGGIGQPVDLFERHFVSEQLRAAPDHDFARLGADGDDVHWLAEAAGQSLPLAHRVACESGVLADHGPARCDQRTGHERRRIRRKTLLQHGDVVVVRYETDLDRLGLLRGDEAELPCGGARLLLGAGSDRRQHPGHDAAVDAPQEVRLILQGIPSAIQRAIPRDRIVPRRDVGAVERVRMMQKI